MTATAKTSYRLSLFFWLDVVSTLSLLLDVPAIQVRIARGAGMPIIQISCYSSEVGVA